MRRVAARLRAVYRVHYSGCHATRYSCRWLEHLYTGPLQARALGQIVPQVAHFCTEGSLIDAICFDYP